MATLEELFEQACQEAIEESRGLRPPYVPTVWIQMIQRHGAADAARRLLESGDIQTGFERLVRAGRLDLTVEMAVLHPKWEGLFGKQHREAAWWRLSQAGRGN
jgi:hypothetical protein